MAFAISLLIIFALQPLLVRKQPPAAEQSKPAAQTAAVSPAEQANSPATKSPDEKRTENAIAAEPGPASGEGVKRGEHEEEITVVGDLYRVVFSSRGAVVKSWQLSKFTDAKKGSLELLNEQASREHGWPLMVWTGDQALRDKVNNALFVPSAKGVLHAPVVLTFEYQEGGISVRKQLSFKPDRYDVAITSNLARDGKPLNHQLAWRGSFGDIHDS